MNLKLSTKLAAITAVAAFLTTACASSNKQIDTPVVDSKLQNNLIKRSTNVASTNIDGLVKSKSTALPHGSYLEFPKSTETGQCFAKVDVPAKYRYKKERVLVTPERKIIETIPATYKMVSKDILVREASTKLSVVPATYTKVSERIMVSEAKEVLKTYPPVYKTVKEKILVKPSRKVWKIGREWKKGSLATKYADSGEIRCLVEVPAVYKTITKRVVAEPARTETVTIPPVYKTIVRTVVDEPAKTLEREIPEITKTVQVRELVKGPSSYEKTVPSVYRTVKRKVITQEPYQMWTKILCRTNDDSQTVRNLQAKLKSLGYYNQGVDGVIGPSTHNAVRKYQSNIQNRPYYDGRITFDTLRNLKVL